VRGECGVVDPNSHLLYSRFGVADDADFVSPICTRLFAYWREKTGDRSHPAWADLNLMDIYGAAPYIMVRDAVDGGADFHCRFCGTALVSVLGKDPTGKVLNDVYQSSGRDMMLERYRYVMSMDAPVRVAGYVLVVEKNLPTGFEGIMLPLGSQAGRVDNILFAMDFSYDPSQDGLAKPER
tara:strand:+ start:198 stop:740 length:543 start_codon:yes stop_codon:yes gene_type:complete